MFKPYFTNARVVAAKVATGVALATASALSFAGDPFSDAVTSSTAAVGTYAAALVTLSAVSVVFMIGMKYVKKIRGAA